MVACTEPLDRDEHHWPTARARALIRASHACERCGTTLGLHVHHREPAEGNRTWGCVHHAANLLVLCAFHHAEDHAWLRSNRRPMQLALAA